MSYCNNCGKSCKNYMLMLTFKDLNNLAKSFPDLQLGDNIDFYKTSEKNKKLEKWDEDFPSIKLKLDGNEVEEYYLGLKFKEKNGDFICTLYDEMHKNCSVHGSHPLICQAYPFKFKNKKKGKFSFEGRCDKKPKIDKNETEEIREILTRYDTTKNVFREYIDVWNDKVPDNEKTLENFYKYISGLAS